MNINLSFNMSYVCPECRLSNPLNKIVCMRKHCSIMTYLLSQGIIISSTPELLATIVKGSYEEFEESVQKDMIDEYLKGDVKIFDDLPDNPQYSDLNDYMNNPYDDDRDNMVLNIACKLVDMYEQNKSIDEMPKLIQMYKENAEKLYKEVVNE